MGPEPVTSSSFLSHCSAFKAAILPLVSLQATDPASAAGPDLTAPEFLLTLLTGLFLNPNISTPLLRPPTQHVHRNDCSFTVNRRQALATCTHTPL